MKLEITLLALGFWVLLQAVQQIRKMAAEAEKAHQSAAEHAAYRGEVSQSAHDQSRDRRNARLALAGRLIDVTIHPASKGLRRVHGKRSV